ncbi:unnamed protein product [marine sediment metagenome]|uniref:Uncharacterized protein n=1 Tax=marine sediment metagenome TaxID=412755 RepID=X1RIX0_9ZZZZ
MSLTISSLENPTTKYNKKHIIRREQRAWGMESGEKSKEINSILNKIDKLDKQMEEIEKLIRVCL